LLPMRSRRTRSDSHRVRDFFAVNSCDVTPAPVRGSGHVLYAPTSQDPDVSACCAMVLSDAERERAARFISEESATRFIQRRAFRRYCGTLALETSWPLSAISFEETDKGRPCLCNAPGLWFSFSACRKGFLGAWSSIYRIGVDIEDPARTVEAAELAQRYFSEPEARAIDTAHGGTSQSVFCQLWSLKEAALKSIGEGLPFGLDAFQFELTPELRIVEAPREHGGSRRFRAYIVEGTGCCGALVTWRAM